MADRTLFVLSSLAIIAGVLFSYSLSVYATQYYGYHEFHFFQRQLFAGLLAISAMWGISRLDPEVWIVRIGFSLFFGFIFLMVIMHFLPDSMTTEAGGARRWIRLPGFSLTPVEFFKVGFVFFLAWSFSRKFSPHQKVGIEEELLMFAPYAVVFCVAVVLIAVLQNDIGQVVVLGATLGVMLLFAGSSFRMFLFLILGALSIIIIAIITSEHRILRIKLWWANAQNFVLSLFPESIASSLRVENLPEPYQIYHSFNSIKNGDIWGVGLGNGLIKLGFLSEVHTDIVLAGIAEELGLMGLFLVTLLIAAIVFRIFKIANRSENQMYYLFCLGVGMLIAFAFLINAYGISGITPIKGIAVPFISYGGSSLMAVAVSVGMILSISKKAKM